MEHKTQTATLAGGCFWCLEAVYQQVSGVLSVVSGYAGGSVPNPSYEAVCGGLTGHTETVQVKFDPKVISYREILEIFFYIHDPTTLNRQGNDHGTQYRSVIFYSDDDQRKTAEDTKAKFAPKYWDDPVITEIVPLEKFWEAEKYHQNYFNDHPEQAYCQVIINPKLQKFRAKFESKLKPDANA
ncbi:MAG TPA: peptide-methionine (S)-S-oxide reductase MsrA [Candidatus Nanoarchaeia archaeon]|nr:peptide-methionine (S)-S-oxide reductase MsrA [Candidatus Nanoarchaeia archaeon]